ncbi:MAG: DUF6261 family protein [Bacteroidota bacterium]
MEKFSFSPLNVNNLTINDLYALAKSTCDMAIPQRTLIGNIPSAVLTELVANNDSMGAQINKSLKSGLTEQITKGDAQSDALLGEVKRTIVFESKSRDEVRKGAAQKLDLFFKPYRDAADKAINTEIAMIYDMLSKYKTNEELKTAAQTIGIATTFDLLDTNNSEVDALYKSRNEQIGQRTTSGSTLKPTVVSDYMQFCSAIEQAASYTPSDALASLFNNMDTLRKKYHALLGNSKAKPTDAPPAV